MGRHRRVRKSATPASALVLLSLAGGSADALAQTGGYPVLPGSGFPFPTAEPATVPAATDGAGGVISPPAYVLPGGSAPDAAHEIVPQTEPEFAPGWTVRPQISVSEAFNDNIFQTQSGKKSDFITYVSPGLSLRGDTPRLQASLDYSPTAAVYASHSDQDFFAQNLSAYGLATLVENTVFLDARGFAGITPSGGGFPVGGNGLGIPSFGGFGGGSSNTSGVLGRNGQTQNYSFSLSPYAVERFSDAGTLTIAYRGSFSAQSGNNANGLSAFNSNNVPVRGSLENSNLFTNEELLQFVSGPRLGRFQDTALFDASQLIGNGVTSGAHQTFITNRLGYAITHTIAVFGELGYEDIGYPNAVPPVTIQDAVWALGTTLTPDPDSTISVGYGHRYGFGSIFLDGVYAVTARTSVYARYLTGLGTDLQTLQTLVAISGTDPYGRVVDSTTGAPLFIGTPSLGVQGNGTLNQTRTYSAGINTTLNRDLISIGVSGSDQTAIASTTGIPSGPSRSIAANIVWTHQISEAATTSLYVGGGEQKQSFLVPGGNNATDTFYGGLATYRYAFTPTFSGLLQYGYFRRDSELSVRKFSQNVALVGVTKQF